MKLEAQRLAAQGRNGDDQLVHMTRSEVAALHGLASLHGTHLTVNPHTGLPEANMLKSLLPAIIGIGGGFLGLSPLMAGLMSGAATTMATGSLQKGLMGGLSGGMMSGLGAGLAGMGTAPAAVGEGMSAGAGAGAAGAGAQFGTLGSGAAGLGAEGATSLGSASAANFGELGSGFSGAGMPASGAMAMPAAGAGVGAAGAGAGVAGAGAGAGGFSPNTFASNMGSGSAWGDQFGGSKLTSRVLPGLMGMSLMGQNMTPDMPEMKNQQDDGMAKDEKFLHRKYTAPTDPYYALHGTGEPTMFSYAQGGVAGLPAGMQDQGTMKLIRALRSRYRSKKAALDDMQVQGSYIQRLGLQDPSDPVLQYAFGYTASQGTPKTPQDTMVPAYRGGGSVSDGMSDSVPAVIDGKRPAKLSANEFIVPSDAVSHLGNGSSDAGAQQLHSMVARIRTARTGRPQQAPAINPRKFMPA